MSSSPMQLRLSLVFDGEIEEARHRALAPLLADAQSLLRAYDSLPEGPVHTTALQFLGVLGGAEIVPGVRTAIEALAGIDSLDWNDKHVVGGPGRQRVQQEIQTARALHTRSEEFCWFKPPHHLAEFRNAAVGVARQQADAVVELIAALSAQSVEDCQLHGEQLDELFGAWSTLDRLNELLDTGDWRDPSDVSDRIGGALGVVGRFTDELGLPDDASVFAAFLEGAEPLKAFARAGARYLQPLLLTPPDNVDESAFGLPLVARQIAVLDKPLHAFRVASYMIQLLGTSWDINRPATRSTLTWALNEGWRLHEAQQRLKSELYRLGVVEPTERDAAALMMSLYRRLAETGYRVYATLALQLRAIATTGAPDAGLEDLPTLGPLRDRLGSETDLACALVHASISPSLRNVEAHESWYWDAARDEVVGDAKDGPLRLALDDLHDHIENVAGAITGSEAALACFLVDQGEALDAPDWLAHGRAPEARNELARIMFAGFGAPIETAVVDDGTLRVTLLEAPADPTKLWGAALGILVGAYHDAERVVVVTADGEQPMIELTATACRAYAEEARHKDFAQVAVFFDANRAMGGSPTHLLGECIALMVHLIEQQDIDRLGDAFERGNFEPIGWLRERLAWVQAFCRSHRDLWTDSIRDFYAHITRAKAAAVRAQGNDQQGLVELSQELLEAADFRDRIVDERGSTAAIFARLQHPWKH